MGVGSPKLSGASGHSPLISRKSSAMTTGPLSMGLPEPLKTRPGVGEECCGCSGPPWVSHCCSPATPSPVPTRPSHPNCPMPSSLQPSVTPRAGYSDCPLGGLPYSPGSLYGKASTQDSDSNGVFRAGKRREPGMADLGRKLGMCSLFQPDPKEMATSHAFSSWGLPSLHLLYVRP